MSSDKTPCNAQVVYLVEDDAGVRESLQWLLGSVGLTVRAFSSAGEFLDQLSGDPPGCVVTDVRMPGMSGLELQETLVERGCTMPVILITGHADVTMAVRAMKTGALDFIEKPFNEQQLLDRIHTALEKSRRVHNERSARTVLHTRFSRLSPRERTVMTGVVAGKSNKAIASELGLSQKTIEVHRAHVMDKMGAGSLAELVQLAIQVR